MKLFNLLVTILALLLLPTSVLAHDFSQTDGLFFNATSALYRQKTVDRPWQLVSMSNLTIKQSVAFNGRLYLVAENPSGQTLYQQDRSLRFTVSPIVPLSQSVTIKVIGDWLVVLAVNPTGSSLFIDSGDGLKLVKTPLVSQISDLERLMTSGGQLYFLNPVGAVTSIWRYQTDWLLSAQITCANPTTVRQPQLLLSCDDGRLMYPSTINDWSVLSFPLVRGVVGSKELLVGWDKTDNHLVNFWQSGHTTSINLATLSFSQIQQTIVSGQRVLFQSAGLWYELTWQAQAPVLLQIATATDENIVDPSQNGQLFLSGTNAFFSNSTGVWQPITVTGNFNHAQLVATGWLIWQTDGVAGSLTQFAPSGSSNFTKVNPWSSATSPIQAVSFGDDVGYISVVTQSGTGNVNLYKTTDYIHWSRLTLPTKPTLATTITDARSLPAGSLVELEGILTVGPGVISNDVTYLTDALSGIQLFLSQTIGNLPPTINRHAVATGEISTSQIKRVTLSSLSDLEIGPSAELVPPTIAADVADANQGRTVLLQGVVSSLDTDFLSFQQIATFLKVHFTGAKATFHAGDQLQIPAVVDWNSQSGQVEAWATSARFQLISPPAVVSASSPSTSSTSSSYTAPSAPVAKKSSTAKTTAKVSPASSSTTATNPVVPTSVSQQLTPNPSPVLVASETSTNQPSNQQTTVLIIAGLLAGCLSMQGRRFRKLLNQS